MNIRNKTFAEFVRELSSSAPVPGGGGASAAAGALASALVSMVANLTTGKKKYAAYEDDMQRILAETARLSEQLIRLADADAEAFAPLAEAYRLPQNTEQEKRHREEVMKTALLDASNVPLRIMETVTEVIDLTAEAAKKGSRMAVSDAGVAAVFAQAALKGASLNIFINTKSMQDRAAAEELNAKAVSLIEKGQEKTDQIFDQVLSYLRS
jgi:formiminotetrahydrofolate cyclodeaminase